MGAPTHGRALGDAHVLMVDPQGTHTNGRSYATAEHRSALTQPSRQPQSGGCPHFLVYSLCEFLQTEARSNVRASWVGPAVVCAQCTAHLFVKTYRHSDASVVMCTTMCIHSVVFDIVGDDDMQTYSLWKNLRRIGVAVACRSLTSCVGVGESVVPLWCPVSQQHRHANETGCNTQSTAFRPHPHTSRSLFDTPHPTDFKYIVAWVLTSCVSRSLL